MSLQYSTAHCTKRKAIQDDDNTKPDGVPTFPTGSNSPMQELDWNRAVHIACLAIKMTMCSGYVSIYDPTRLSSSSFTIESYQFHLLFATPGYEAKILGPSLMELDQGSQLANFTCIISHGRSPSPPNISWFFNEIPIQKAKGRFSVDTEKSSYQTVSILVILKPQSGKYSCGGM